MFRIAHLSDLHVAPLPWPSLGELASKRVLGFLSWHTRRKREHRMEILQALAEDLARQAPDHFCITGDLTNITLPGEVDIATDWVARLAEPQRLSVIPGNHDAYVGGALDYALQRWAAWMRDDEGRTGFPYLHRRGPADIIGLSSAVATAPGLSLGRVGPEQIERTAALLDGLAPEGRARVLMVHHPPHDGACSPRRGLADRHLLHDLLRRHRVDIVLHGHLHQPVRASLDGPEGPIPVFGASAASARGRRKAVAHYHLIEIDSSGGTPKLSVEHHHYDLQTGRFRAGRREAL